jgi:hypothetical protein
MAMKSMKTLLLLLLLSPAFAQPRTINFAWIASTTPACSTTVTTNCVSGYNLYRSASSTGPWLVPLNATPIVGLNYSDPTAVIGQTYTYALTAFSIACTTPSNAPPTGWNFCGSSSPSLTGTLTVPSAPNGTAGFTWAVP